MKHGRFLDDRRLLYGPWQAFERDVARLLSTNGFGDVRIVGGSGDRGGDVLGRKNDELWVIQCKYTRNGYASASAADEVAEAGRFYRADRMFVALSRPAGPALREAIAKWAKIGVKIEVLEPRTLELMCARGPEYPASRRDLRDYQEEAVQRFEEAMRETGRGQVVLATGLGKTVVMSELTTRLFEDGNVKGNRALVMAATRELVDQLEVAFWKQLATSIPTHRLAGGEFPSFWDGVTFATVQSAVARLDELPDFGLVLIDEAHHVGSNSFRQVTDRMEDAMIGGVTATPWRGDGYDIDTLLGQPALQVGIAEGLRRGFLCEADYRMFADDIDWQFVRERSRNQYSIKQLNQRLLLPTRDEEAARKIRTIFDEERRRSGIVFCPTVLHAKSFAGMLGLFGFRSAAMTGDMTARERDEVMAGFRSGALDIVTTRDLFNEGVDIPDVDLVVFMRVTHSRRIFVQQLGRGLRTSPLKDKVVVLDFVSDIRRIAEVIQLEKGSRGDIERLRLPGVIEFRDASAGGFMLEWMKDQADLLSREGDPTLELPSFDFPKPHGEGNVQ